MTIESEVNRMKNKLMLLLTSFGSTNETSTVFEEAEANPTGTSSMYGYNGENKIYSAENDEIQTQLQ